MSSLKRFFLKTVGQIIPSDIFSFRYPVSVKGICIIDDKVVLVKNEREEWDLPGGKLKRKEQPEECLRREIKEELNIEVQVEKLLSVEILHIMKTINVLVVIYLCKTSASLEELKISYENFDLAAFHHKELPQLNLSKEYQKVIKEVMPAWT